MILDTEPEIIEFFKNHDKAILRDDLMDYEDEHIDGTYVCYDMAIKAGEMIDDLRLKITDNRFCFYCRRDGYYYNLDMIKCFIEDRDNIVENSNLIEINKGDLVRIKKKQFEEEKIGEIKGVPIIRKICNDFDFNEGEFIVCDIQNDIIFPYYLDGNYSIDLVKTNLVEVIEANYLDNLKNKKRLTEKEKQILDDLDIMEEMKSKVNIKDFKKIYAGTMARIPNNLKGIDLILHQWAYQKKHIYKMLGNNLSISKEIEYIKTEFEIEQDRQKMYREFPGIYYVLKNINNKSLLDNKLEHELSGWDYMSYLNKSVYHKGDKVTKILDEAFHNDKLLTMYSDIIATNKIKGVLEISIDPIEILLMSCNVSGWTSCHRIGQPNKSKAYGQYSSGIFSYICDNVTMIAYRHDGELYDLKMGKQKVQVHSKNWRQLIYINKDFKRFITSRQYPNKVEEITKEVRELLEAQINNYLGEEQTWVHTNAYKKVHNHIEDKIRANYYSKLWYNDIVHGSDGDMCYIKDTEDENAILVGSYPVCPNCGKRLLEYTSTPICHYCSNNND